MAQLGRQQRFDLQIARNREVVVVLQEIRAEFKQKFKGRASKQQLTSSELIVVVSMCVTSTTLLFITGTVVLSIMLLMKSDLVCRWAILFWDLALRSAAIFLTSKVGPFFFTSNILILRSTYSSSLITICCLRLPIDLLLIFDDLLLQPQLYTNCTKHFRDTIQRLFVIRVLLFFVDRSILD